MPDRFQRGASKHWATCPRFLCFRVAIGPSDGNLECPKHGAVASLGDSSAVRTPLEAT